ncbi:MAG: ROK family protein [Terriglobales bacterium]
MIGAIDIGGTKLAVGLVDERGKVLARREAATGPESTYSAGLESIAGMLREMAKSARVEITGIGIGSTGPVDPLTGELGEVDFLPHWRRQNPVQDLARLFGLQVALENDADAGALAEAAWGAGREKSRLIYITVGTGIGGGIILEGKLYRGVDGAHPELGHQVIDPSGPPCSCGFNGCWEALAAGPALAAWTQSQSPADDSYRTAEQICQMARNGDPLARRAVKREAHYLGLGIANLINLFTPDIIVLAGSLMKSAPLFLEEVRATICRGCRFVPYEKTELALASLGDDANLIGAARVWHHRFGGEDSAAKVRLSRNGPDHIGRS